MEQLTAVRHLELDSHLGGEPQLSPQTFLSWKPLRWFLLDWFVKIGPVWSGLLAELSTVPFSLTVVRM